MVPYRLVHIVLFLAVSWYLHGQINGRIYDAEAYAPLSGAVIAGEAEQTISGIDGKFSLEIPDSSILIVSHLGYKNDTITSKVSEIFLVPDYTQLEQVTIRGPMLQNSLMDLPSSISMLHSSDLKQTSGITYLEELNRLPGVFVHSGTLNTNRVTIRGIGSRTPYGSNRIKAYFNHIPLSSGDGTTSLEDIDPAMINTVEIIKGSKSAVYGSGLGGIIILSSREYFEDGFHGSVALESASYGTVNPQLSLQYKKGMFSGSAAYSYARSDGWRKNSSLYRHSVNVFTSITTKRSKTDVLIYLIDMKAFIPSSLNEEDFNNAPESAAPNWLSIQGFEEYQRMLTGIRNELEIADKLCNTTVLHLNYYNGYESRPFNILADNALQGGLKSMLNYNSNGWRFRLGIDMMFEKYNWQIYETLKGEQGQELNSYSEIRNPISFFAHSAYTFYNGGILEAGLSYNFLNYKISDLLPDSMNHSGNYSYKPVLSPFFGINLPLSKVLRIYASVGHGFSYPNVEETLLPEGQVNPDLKPESGLNMELGTRISALDGKLFVDANVYLMLVENLLVTERKNEDVFYGKNAGKTRHMGFETSTSIRLNEKSSTLLPQTRVNLSFSLSDNRFTGFTNDDMDYTGNALPGIPSTNIFAGASFSYHFGLYAYIQYSYIGKQYLNDGNTGIYKAYDLTGLKLGYKLPGKKFSPNFYFGIQNLFNRHYASMLLVNAPSFGGAEPRYYYPGQPRSYYLGIDVSF